MKRRRGGKSRAARFAEDQEFRSILISLLAFLHVCQSPLKETPPRLGHAFLESSSRLLLSLPSERWVQYGHRAELEQITAARWLTAPPPPHYPVSARLEHGFPLLSCSHTLPLTRLCYLFSNSPYELLKYSVLLKSYLMPLTLGDDLDSHFTYLKKRLSIDCDLPAALCFISHTGWPARPSLISTMARKGGVSLSHLRFTFQSFVYIPSPWDDALFKGKYCFIDLKSQLTIIFSP